MRVLVTGATGLLGAEVARQLERTGAVVGHLARDPRPATGVRVAADLADRPALDAAVRAFRPDAIVHLAAAVGDRLDPAVARALNVDATLTLERVAADLACRRFVVASTVLVLGLDDLVDATEDQPLTRDPLVPYVATKVQMEEALDLSRTTVLRFPRIYGAADKMIVPAMLRLMRAGKMLLIDGGRALQSFVHVEDAARACLLALTTGAPGVYHVTGGDRVTNKEILDLITGAAGLPRVTRSVPRGLALALATLAESAVRVLRLPPPERLSRFRVKYLGCHHHYSIAKARRDLGYEPQIRIQDGLPAVVCALEASR